MEGAHTLVPEKLARDVQILTSHDHDLLAVKKLLGHDASQTTKEMSLAIDNDLRNPHPLAQLFPGSYPTSFEAPHKLLSSSRMVELTTGSNWDILAGVGFGD